MSLAIGKVSLSHEALIDGTRVVPRVPSHEISHFLVIDTSRTPVISLYDLQHIPVVRLQSDGSYNAMVLERLRLDSLAHSEPVNLREVQFPLRVHSLGLHLDRHASTRDSVGCRGRTIRTWWVMKREVITSAGIRGR